MPDEVKRKAFDPLFTTKEKGGRRGQGLGLEMVFERIQSINSDVKVIICSGKVTRTFAKVYFQQREGF